MILAAAAALLAAPAALAQNTKAPGADSRPAPPTAPPAKAGAPAAPRAESRPVVYHNRVAVTLKNGQKLAGITKNNRLAECESGLGFRAAEKSEQGAGLRLWFASPGQNWLFLPYRDIETVATTGRVSDIEVRDMEAKFDNELRDRIERETGARVAEIQAELRAREEARQSEEKAAAKAKSEESEKRSKAEVDQAKKLLDRYPPELGWGEERQKEILARKNNRIYPSAEEAEFLKVYDQWTKAKGTVEKAEKKERGEPVEEDEEPAPEESTGKPGKKTKEKKPAPGGETSDDFLRTLIES